jgi:hypothetical protein
MTGARKGNKLYLVGLKDFSVELGFGPKTVKRLKREGAPISCVDRVYRARTEELLEWMLEQERGKQAVA